MMKQIVVKAAEGLYYIETPRTTETAASLETLVEKSDPGIPAEQALVIARWLEGQLGDLGHISVITGLRDG